MKYSLVAFLLLTLVGCELVGGSEALPVRLDADAASYQRGQDVVLTLINNSGRTFTVHPNLCGAVLQHWERAAWVPEHYDGVCTLIGFELRSGNQLVARQPLHDSLSAGDYRFMVALSDAEGEERYRRFERIEVYTKVFKVEP